MTKQPRTPSSSVPLPRRRTVAGDLLRWLGTITVFLIILLGAAYYFYMDYSVSRRLRQEAQRAGDVFAKVLEQPLYLMDNERAEKVAEVYISSGRIAGVRIELASGEAIFDNLASVSPSIPREQRNVYGGGLYLGKATIAFDDSQYTQAREEVVRTTVIGIFFMLLVDIFCIRWILRSILIPPLQLLGQRLQQIAGGTYDGTLPPVPQEEINVVVEAANRMANEIAERTRRLVESEKNYREVFNSTGDAIIIQDADSGEILDVNRTMLELYGYTRDEVMHMSQEAVSRHELPMVSEEEGKYWRKAVAGTPQVFFWHARKKTGELFWGEVAVKRTNIASKDVILVVVRDISDRIRLEGELHQAQKMDALGTLAGGIAHDFNNILSGIMGYTDLAKMEVDPHSKMMKYLTHVESASVRARDLIRQILTFSRKEEGRLDIVSVASVVAEALKLLRSTMPVSIDIVQTIHARPIVYADSSQIHQVVMNLCMNAFQAMEEKGGTLSVRVYEIEIWDAVSSKDEDLPMGRYAALEVSDTGIGMSEETRSRIFEPYFTTKGGNKGSGLGLAVVHGIVRNSGGKISVNSSLGAGTMIRVSLPVTEREESTQTGGGQPAAVLQHGRILFVDDEEAIRGSASDFLTRHGFKVTSCPNAEDALARLQQHPFSYDLLITDMTMPGMSGLDLAHRVRGFGAALPIILCTGFSAGLSRESLGKMNATMFLQKPLMMGELLVAINEILTAAGS
ncbi:MAG: response regulator [Ignavibacteriales bacterium]|nr:response regulator [Ignavibacteriales bacterium]